MTDIGFVIASEAKQSNNGRIMAKQVKIRFLGSHFWKGIPKRRFIDVGKQRFWNYNRFPEQLEDSSYLRPIEFYEKNKDILSNRKIFVIEFLSEVSGALTPKGEPQEPISILTPELEEKGVLEIDGILACPDCTFITETAKQMGLHLIEHG
jgi:uncharacterized Fe-S cluster-containing radical SAM superfamily protein